MGFASYSPLDTIVGWNGVQLLGYANDTFIEVAYDEDAFTAIAGAGGDVVRTLNLNEMASITVTLLEESPSNAYLATAAYQDRLFGLSTGPMFVKNVRGTYLGTGDTAWIKKVADVSYAKESGQRQWTFAVAKWVTAGGGVLVF